MGYPYIQRLLGNEKKWIIDTQHNMNESQSYYDEWKKPDQKKKECVLRDSIHTKFYKMQRKLEWQEAGQWLHGGEGEGTMGKTGGSTKRPRDISGDDGSILIVMMVSCVYTRQNIKMYTLMYIIEYQHTSSFESSSNDTFIIDLREREREREKEKHQCKRETLTAGLLYLPWPGFEPTTFWCTRWCSIQLSHPTRAILPFLKMYSENNNKKIVRLLFHLTSLLFWKQHTTYLLHRASAFAVPSAWNALP